MELRPNENEMYKSLTDFVEVVFAGTDPKNPSPSVLGDYGTPFLRVRHPTALERPRERDGVHDLHLEVLLQPSDIVAN
jgi:hypothetical protein